MAGSVAVMVDSVAVTAVIVDTVPIAASEDTEATALIAALAADITVRWAGSTASADTMESSEVERWWAHVVTLRQHVAPSSAVLVAALMAR